MRLTGKYPLPANPVPGKTNLSIWKIKCVRCWGLRMGMGIVWSPTALYAVISNNAHQHHHVGRKRTGGIYCEREEKGGHF